MQFCESWLRGDWSRGIKVQIDNTVRQVTYMDTDMAMISGEGLLVDLSAETCLNARLRVDFLSQPLYFPDSAAYCLLRWGGWYHLSENGTKYGAKPSKTKNPSNTIFTQVRIGQFSLVFDARISVDNLKDYARNYGNLIWYQKMNTES